MDRRHTEGALTSQLLAEPRESRRDSGGTPPARQTGGQFFHTHLGSLTLGGMAVALGAALWDALSTSHAVPAYMLPPPVSVAKDWWALAQNGVLWHHVAATLQEALLGFALAFVAGVTLAYPLAKSRIVASV